MCHKSDKYGIHIGLDQAVFLCLQKYTTVLHDMFGHGIFGADGSSKGQLLCVCMLPRHVDTGHCYKPQIPSFGLVISYH